MGRSTDMEAVIDRQFDAFNAGDANAFAAAYDEDAIVADMMSGQPPLVGREAIRAHYAAMFGAVPELRASIEARMVVGNLVTDHELITPLNVRAVAVYEVENDLVRRAWLFGPVPA